MEQRNKSLMYDTKFNPKDFEIHFLKCQLENVDSTEIDANVSETNENSALNLQDCNVFDDYQDTNYEANLDSVQVENIKQENDQESRESEQNDFDFVEVPPYKDVFKMEVEAISNVSEDKNENYPMDDSRIKKWQETKLKCKRCGNVLNLENGLRHHNNCSGRLKVKPLSVLKPNIKQENDQEYREIEQKDFDFVDLPSIRNVIRMEVEAISNVSEGKNENCHMDDSRIKK